MGSSPLLMYGANNCNSVTSSQNYWLKWNIILITFLIPQFYHVHQHLTLSWLLFKSYFLYHFPNDLPRKQVLLNYLDSHPSAAAFQIATWSSFPHMELAENIYSLQLNRIISWSRESIPVLLFHDVFSRRSENVEALRQKTRAVKTIHGSCTIMQPCLPLTFKPFTFLIAEFFRQAHTPDAAGSSRESRVRSSDLCPWPVLGGACKSVKATTGKTCTSWCWVRGYKSAVWLDTRRRRVDF